MSKNDWDYFNCSEDYEIDYVSNLYEDKRKVKEFIIQKCSNGTIKNWTHEELYEFLEKNGFTKKHEEKCHRDEAKKKKSNKAK